MHRKEERTMMPSFGRKRKIENNKIRHKAKQMTLRADKNARKKTISLYRILETKLPLWFQKRVSLSGFSKRHKASMTVEAAIVFSIFLIAVFNLLSVLEFVRLQSNMSAALHQVGKKLSIYGYAYDKSGLELEDYPLASVAFSYSYVKATVENYIGKEYLDDTVLKHGKSGIYYGNSKIMEKDRIDIVTLYEVNGLFSYIETKEIPMFSRFYGHVWNGYDVENKQTTEDGEEYVFITQNGTVYHRNRNCTYLNPSIKAVLYENLKEERNENGAIYYACEKCGNTKKSVVYITDQGTRYHTSLECSGLKRTIYSIPISEVGGRSPCSKCG